MIAQGEIDDSGEEKSKRHVIGRGDERAKIDHLMRAGFDRHEAARWAKLAIRHEREGW